ncbi:hypothetical protein H2199_002371 [Coniosporium tulheliwenetii]|uniref:Uncharacterized protein n=1 Tax=Coniosporium tulheliwenetii TaxID=3383036 RepID=A0ACC2ZFG1_9PEZI|nr:hypothetical protein H2199_002371 [Cladosporium sp. JES 115]
MADGALGEDPRSAPAKRATFSGRTTHIDRPSRFTSNIGKMVYDWEGKEAECYRLYVEERLTVDAVMRHYAAVGFNPSKRAFQTQFKISWLTTEKRWDFPSKQNPAHKNEPLVARVKELWERNTNQKEMLRILNSEGFDIKERELMRLRARNRWLLRVPNGMQARSYAAPLTPQPDTETHDSEQAAHLEIVSASATSIEQIEAATEREASPSYRQRRRTRGWAGLPADPQGPPRFPSETTIDESKVYLNLENAQYREVRDQFQSICEEEGVAKKTIAGAEKWQAVKDRLIRENQHLQDAFWNDQLHRPELKALALDVICTDVTKRMRTLERRMTIAEAKNALSINPEESRQIRNAFYATLKADCFTSKLEAGNEHWQDLKSQWIAGSELLQRILAPGAADPDHFLKVKAIEVLCRDVMKRLRDDQTKRDPTRKKQASSGPGPGPAPPRPAAPSNASTTLDHTSAAPTAQMTLTQSSSEQLAASRSDLQIDPSLLLAAHDSSIAAAHHQQASYEQQSHYNAASRQASSYPIDSYAPNTCPPQPQAIAIFCRLSPISPVQREPKIWLDVLATGSIAELRHLILSRHPGTTVARIEGVVSDQSGREILYPLDQDDELYSYVAHVSGGKATFVVHLVESYT